MNFGFNPNFSMAATFDPTEMLKTNRFNDLTLLFTISFCLRYNRRTVPAEKAKMQQAGH